MLFGLDLSHWNKEKPYIGDFQIHKITEGRGYVDESFAEWWNKCNVAYLGIYHFITPNGSAESQAKHLINTMKSHDVKNCMVILDWETAAKAKYKDGSIVKDIITSLWSQGLNFQPIIYLDKSACEQLSIGKHFEWFKNNCCFWVADYSSPNFQMLNYSGVKPLMRQFTNKPMCDMNVFYGNHISLEKICKETYFNENKK